MNRRTKDSSLRIERPDRVQILEPQRRVFWFKACLLYPHVGVGWESPDEAESGGLRAHKHDESIEISFFMRGQVAWRVSGTAYDVRRGDLFVTRPGERHGGIDDVKEPCERYYLELIVPTDDKRLPAATVHQTQALAAAFAALESHVFRGSDEVHRLFEHLIALHDHSRQPINPSLDKLDAWATLHRLLLEVLRCADKPAATTGAGLPHHSVSLEIGGALQWMHQNLAQSVDIGSIADRAGLSISAFHRRFLLEVGMTPSEYRTRQRLERARELLLQQDYSITAIAHELGFSTSQYFATVFRKYVGQTPREFRRSASR